MKRRDQARQKKRKERERKLRRERHEAQYLSAGDATFDDDEISVGDADGLDESGDMDDPDGGDGDDLDLPDDAEADAFDVLSDYAEERMGRRLARAAATCSSDEEREHAMAALQGKTVEEIDAAYGEDPVEAAHDMALRAWRADARNDATLLAMSALALDPACIDARAVMAVSLRRSARRLAGLREVIDDAERTLGGELALRRQTGTIWQNVSARPCLRARQTWMHELLDADRARDAIAEGEALLRLDPDDHMGVGSDLLGALLEVDDLMRARALIETHREAAPVAMIWGRILESFLSGDLRSASTLRRVALFARPEVEDMILGRRPKVHDTLEARFHAEIAEDMLRPYERAWSRHRGARRWLADGAPATTAAERLAAARSYTEPGSRLLVHGKTDFGGPGKALDHWVDYPLLYGLHAGHIPELLRMADDQALHESDRGDEAWAPLHAWRSLALLAARGHEAANGVYASMLQRLWLDLDDDWVIEDTIHIVGIIGAPALAETTALFTNVEHPSQLRSTAANALAEIGERHPALRRDVIRTLCDELEDVVQHLEASQRDGADPGIEDDEYQVVDMIIMSLMNLEAGHGEGGEACVSLVERALDADIINERACGTRDEILNELRGVRPRRTGEVASEAE